MCDFGPTLSQKPLLGQKLFRKTSNWGRRQVHSLAISMCLRRIPNTKQSACCKNTRQPHAFFSNLFKTEFCWDSAMIRHWHHAFRSFWWTYALKIISPPKAAILVNSALGFWHLNGSLRSRLVALWWPDGVDRRCGMLPGTDVWGRDRQGYAGIGCDRQR